MTTALEALGDLCSAYADDFGQDGYDKRDMVDYVVCQTLQEDLSAHAQANGIGIHALIAWYEARVKYLKRSTPEMEKLGISPGSPTEEQRERRGKVTEW